ncbi:MAG: hypothetical protein JXB35_07895 [Anaerolineae bacterium]|nr:hypothetical protein [Anaerolineae bacterium]
MKRRNLIIGALLLLLMGLFLLARWLTVPGHAPGQIIIAAQDVGQPVITARGNASDQPGYRVSLYDTVWPTDMANLNRSNCVVNAGLPRNVTADTVAIESVEMPYPVFAYTRDEDEVFVIGGTSFVLDRYVSEIDGMGDLGVLQGQSAPHITKYNPFTGEQTRLELDRGAGSGYVGGALVHANGYVYVVFQSHLYKIEPESMTIERSVDMPLAPGLASRFTIYNGLSTSSTGELVTKYWSLASDASSFFLIDPDTLEITAQLDYPGASPRLTVAPAKDSNEYLYHLNTRETFRMRIEQGALTLDPQWISRYDPYHTGQTENEEPTSPVVANGRVFYTTNTVFSATEPMRIFWQDVEAIYSSASRPLTGPELFAGGEKGGWSFFHLSIDESTGIIIGNDQGNGLLTAVRAKGDNEIERLWQIELNTGARPVIVSDRKMVYATDFVDGHDHLVVLDLMTGEEILRVPTPATRATISTIIVSSANEVYFGSNEPGRETGLFHRLVVSVPQDDSDSSGGGASRYCDGSCWYGTLGQTPRSGLRHLSRPC